MHTNDDCTTILELLLKEQNKMRRRDGVTQVTEVTRPLTNCNNNNKIVPTSNLIQVSPGLHHLEKSGVSVQQTAFCIDYLCSYFRQADGGICGLNGQPVLDLFEKTGQCPDNRWRKLNKPTSEYEDTGTCSICGSDQWWRPFGQNRRICSVCHPPALTKSQYQDLTTKES